LHCHVLPFIPAFALFWLFPQVVLGKAF